MGSVGQLWGFLAELIDETHSRLPHIAVVGMADATHTIDGAVVLPDEAIVTSMAQRGERLKRTATSPPRPKVSDLLTLGATVFPCFEIHDF